MLQRILVPLDGARLVLVRAVEAHAFTGRGRSEARVAVMTEAEYYPDRVAHSLRAG